MLETEREINEHVGVTFQEGREAGYRPCEISGGAQEGAGTGGQLAWVDVFSPNSQNWRAGW